MKVGEIITKPKYDFEELKKNLLKLANSLQKSPSNDDIKNDPNLPSSPSVLSSYFIKKGYFSTYQFLEEMGFERPKRSYSKFEHMDFDDMCKMFDDWYDEYDYYPSERVCRKRNHLPQLNILKLICGDRYKEFRKKYNMKILPNKDDYEEYVEVFIEESEKQGYPLKWSQLDANNYLGCLIPTAKWMVDNCPSEDVSSYNELLEYMGFKPRYLVSKEYATKKILELYEEKGKLCKDDFYLHDHANEIGSQTIVNHWGSMNNMFKELGIPINWEKQRDKQTLEEFKQDIVNLCNHIEDTTGRKTISYKDIDDSYLEFSHSVYSGLFKDELGMTLADFIEHIGFKTSDNGIGTKYKFGDGEVTLSHWENIVSTYLRRNGFVYNQDYYKDVPYTYFIDSYKGNRSIDYIINNYWYIEVAGMDTKGIEGTKKGTLYNYQSNLKEKIKMLESENLNYKILYPKDFERPLDEVFSFLYKEGECVGKRKTSTILHQREKGFN